MAITYELGYVGVDPHVGENATGECHIEPTVPGGDHDIGDDHRSGDLDQTGHRPWVQVTEDGEKSLKVVEVELESPCHARQTVLRKLLEELLEESAEEGVVGAVRIQLEKQCLDRISRAEAYGLEPLQGREGSPQLGGSPG